MSYAERNVRYVFACDDIVVPRLVAWVSQKPAIEELLASAFSVAGLGAILDK